MSKACRFCFIASHEWVLQIHVYQPVLKWAWLVVWYVDIQVCVDANARLICQSWTCLHASLTGKHAWFGQQHCAHCGLHCVAVHVGHLERQVQQTMMMITVIIHPLRYHQDDDNYHPRTLCITIVMVITIITASLALPARSNVSSETYI